MNLAKTQGKLADKSVNKGKQLLVGLAVGDNNYTCICMCRLKVAPPIIIVGTGCVAYGSPAMAAC